MRQNSIKHIRKTAVDWFFRLQTMDADHPDRGVFEAWVLSSSKHQTEYAGVEKLWNNLDSNEHIDQLSSAFKIQNQLQQRNQFKTAATALSLAFICIGSFLGYQLWQSQPVMQMAMVGSVGQVQEQQLDDGSKVTVNANTELDITYYRNQRVVNLKKGEAIFEVARDESRPFIVDSGIAKVKVLGTRFAVNKLQKFVRISVDHGRVQVQPQNADGANAIAPIILVNGQVAEVEAYKAPKLVNKSALDAFSFNHGVINFDDAGLAEITETLSRYRQQPIYLESTNANDTHITAVVKSQNVDSFLRNLPNIAPVEIANQVDSSIVVKEIR